MLLIVDICSQVFFHYGIGPFSSPSGCGWKAVLSLRSMANFSVIFFYRSEVNIVPVSVMILCGTLCTPTISFMKRLATCRASGSFEHRLK